MRKILLIISLCLILASALMVFTVARIEPAQRNIRMYVGLRDINNKYAYIDHSNPNAAREIKWTQWEIKLSDFNSPDIVDLNSIRSIRIGFGKRCNPINGPLCGEGTVIFDDILVFAEEGYTLCPVGEIMCKDGVPDCVVDLWDLAVIAAEWLCNCELDADLKHDSIVNFIDYALLADNWLKE